MCTPSLAPLRIAVVPLGAVVNHLSLCWAPPPPLFAGSWLTPGDWMHDAEDVSSVAAHRVITTSILSMPASRSTLSRLRWFRLARLALCGPKLGFTSGLARMTKTAPLAYTACCCFEQRVNPTTTSREEALSRNQPKEKNQKRDSES